MKQLTVIYDAKCGFCTRCRWWMVKQPSYLKLDFFPSGSLEIETKFPGLKDQIQGEELIAVSDEGGIYRGARAWIMCLYALQEYREWSIRLSHPLLRSFKPGNFVSISRDPDGKKSNFR